MKNIILLTLALLLSQSSSSIKYYNKVSLSDNNTIVNYTQMKYLDTVLSVALDIEGIKNQLVVINPLSDETKDNFNGGELKAMVVHHNSAFYIFIDEQTHTEAIESLSHEVIHVEQYLSNELIVNGQDVFWRGEEWTTDNIPYEYRPWEEAAFELQSNVQQKVESILTD